jgi:uncharacterized membrane protein
MFMRVLIFIHVLGAILFLGNIITAAFWKIVADCRRDLQGIYNTARNVMIADFVFTLPGIVMLLVTGHILMAKMGLSLTRLSWVSVSYGVFIFSAVVWTAVLLPSQNKMIREAKASLSSGQLTLGYQRASMLWNVFGVVATLLPFVVLYLMVVKPF